MIHIIHIIPPFQLLMQMVFVCKWSLNSSHYFEKVDKNDKNNRNLAN